MVFATKLTTKPFKCQQSSEIPAKNTKKGSALSLGEQGGSSGMSRSECPREDSRGKAEPSRMLRASPAVVTSQALAWLESQSKTYCALNTPTMCQEQNHTPAPFLQSLFQ